MTFIEIGGNLWKDQDQVGSTPPGVVCVCVGGF